MVKGDFIEMAAMYISAAIHDYDHPGTNNNFHKNTLSQHAIRYNDKSVLENHHVSAAFALMREDNYNIFKNFTREKFQETRERMISLVLATDMANHFSDVAKMKTTISQGIDMKDKDKSFMMNIVLHSADVGNPFKNWDSCSSWAFRILDEFWA
eukprot:CAMPEP_0114602146 /NCGR_PEP_ID=MMETSP0125-20121206/24761_1 /TAXON_ID=485358 ORGANISM="Aristerostoma sp., Strain ATCC 50986" /NCGR_SAMPLE_ID=MMETSP0125 /ASSEMBLY_ACC=CAM_ASM_000245 /LENGTH=153 /DNA_ID=CAMNT_0001812075 /DNA_START=241 /DNA_END=702 /DNA_ORIENTATION=+